MKEIGFDLGFFQDGIKVLWPNNCTVQQSIPGVWIQNPGMCILFQHTSQDKFPFYTVKNIIGSLIIRDIDVNVNCLPDDWIIAQGTQHICLHGNLTGFIRQAPLLEADAAQFQEGLVHCANAADWCRAHDHSVIGAFPQLV